MSLSVWSHVPIPEPTNVAWGCSARTGPALEFEPESVLPKVHRRRFPQGKSEAFFPKGRPESQQTIMRDAFYRSPIPFLLPTFCKSSLAMPAHLLSLDLTRIHLPYVPPSQTLPSAGATQCCWCREHFSVPSEINAFKGHFLEHRGPT